MKIAVVGGDKRSGYLAELLKKNNREIKWFYGENGSSCDEDFLYNSDILVLPVPVFKKGKFFAPYCKAKIDFKKIINAVGKNTYIFGGGDLPTEALNYYDLLKDEDFNLKNADATAEAALYFAIENMPVAICGAQAGIVGMGRIGRALYKKLTALGAETFYFRRSPELLSGNELTMESLPLKAGDFDVIFNTAPATVLTPGVISHMKKEAVIIDLASAPGGTDFEYAEKRGIKATLASGLPGRYSPKSAAEYILYAMDKQIFKERGEKLLWKT